MFQSARLKLTLWYLVIIMAVSSFFSLIVYRGFTKELGRGFRFQAMHEFPERRVLIQRQGGFTRILPFWIYPEEIPPEEFAEIISLAKRRFALQLIIINSGILVLAGTAGYFLAGKTLQPIEDMVDEQKRFVADASHELRSPLTAIKSEVEVALRDKKLNLKDAKTLLTSNLQEVEKMKNFSDYLLSLSRYESNGKDLPMAAVDLTKVIKQAIKRNEPLAKEKKIDIKENLTKVIVKGHSESLTELISILINNAVKYSPEGKNISVITRIASKRAVIEVKDQGIGINQKDLPHIFDRFYRVDTSRNKKGVDLPAGEAGGYGLGLSIAKSIVAVHHGEIKTNSTLGKGSTFTISLPLTT